MEKKDYDKLYKERQQEFALRLNDLTRQEENWFWEMTTRQLKWYIYKFTQNQEDILEILSITVDKIIKGQDKYKPEKALFTSWAHRIAHNEAINYVFLKNRDNKRSLRIDKDDEFFEISAEEPIEQGDIDALHAIVLEEIDKLKPTLKIIAQRYLIDGEKQHELAEELGINPNTLKTNVRAIKEQVSKRILKKHRDLVY
jgi:RNA polymerase sigma factor (sigma-70 family)